MKTIFLDIDGTLMDHHGIILPESIEAIQKTRQKGNRVFLTTGRTKAEIHDTIWGIGVDGLIGANGMYIEVEGQVIKDLSLPVQQVKKVVDWLSKEKLGFYLESKNGVFANEYFIDIAKTKFSEKDEIGTLMIEKLFPTVCTSEELYRDDIAKINFLITPSHFDLAKTIFSKELKVQTWSIIGDNENFGEFSKYGVNKGKAIMELISHLNIKHIDTVAIGDQKNDIEMIEYCATGIAMGNGIASLKAVADHVTDKINKKGLWKAFKKFDLI